MGVNSPWRASCLVDKAIGHLHEHAPFPRRPFLAARLIKIHASLYAPTKHIGVFDVYALGI